MSKQSRKAVTMIELLIVVGIITLLTAVALPNVRDQLREQKTKRAADMVKAYINRARARAINSGLPYGIVLRRAGVGSAAQRSKCLEIGFARRAPDYGGDTVGATIVITGATSSPRSFSFGFPTLAAPLRTSQTISEVAGYAGVSSSGRTYFHRHPFLRSGDTVTFAQSLLTWEVTAITRSGSPATTQLDMRPVDPSQRVDVGVTGSIGLGTAANDFQLQRYVETSTVPLDMPRGTAIDFVYSGVGLGGTQFSPMEITSPATDANRYSSTAHAFSNLPIDFQDVWIMFDASGRLDCVLMGERFRDENGNALSDASGTPLYRRGRQNVSSDIYLLIGRDGQTDPSSPIQVGDEPSSVLDPENVWVTISGSTGEVGSITVDDTRGTPDSSWNLSQLVRWHAAEARNQISPELVRVQ